MTTSSEIPVKRTAPDTAGRRFQERNGIPVSPYGVIHDY